MFQETNKKRIPWNKGKKGAQVVSEETRAKLRIIRKGNQNAKGSKRTQEQKDNISRKLSGSLHYAWKGGVTRDKHCNKRATSWRAKVFERDNWTCQTCNVRGVYLESHHIKSWAEFPSLRYVLDNGVTLCRDCHKLTSNYKGKNHAISRNDSV